MERYYTKDNSKNSKNKFGRKEEVIKSKIETLTGIRPTGNLTLANYLGGVKPILELQDKGFRPVLFVADLHAITDNEPKKVAKFSQEIVADYLALGINPKKTIIYLQSDIAGQVTTLMALLARHITVAELLRVPTLKDKLKNGARPETANTLLFLYPVMMAADILIQRAKKIPVGEDQVAHLEVSRELARRFNNRYGNIFPVPQVLQVEVLRILSLKGIGKMSKSLPEGAIFLTDSSETVTQKIKRAETCFEGKMTEKLESHILLAKGLCKNKSELKEIDNLIKQHMNGKPVMNKFKQLLTHVTVDFLKRFQKKRAKVKLGDVRGILEKGAKIAMLNADETLMLVKQALIKS